jgi:putative DNA primase/helicase
VQWERVLGCTEDFSVKMIIERAVGTEAAGATLPAIEPDTAAPELREALLVVAGSKGSINSYRLGKFLGRNKGRIVDGRQIITTRTVNGFQHWGLAKTS